MKKYFIEWLRRICLKLSVNKINFKPVALLFNKLGLTILLHEYTYEVILEKRH